MGPLIEDMLLKQALKQQAIAQETLDAEEIKWREAPANWEARFRAQQRLLACIRIVEAIQDAIEKK